VMGTDYHKWKGGLTKEELEKQIEFYKKRYKQ